MLVLDSGVSPEGPDSPSSEFLIPQSIKAVALGTHKPEIFRTGSAGFLLDRS